MERWGQEEREIEILGQEEREIEICLYIFLFGRNDIYIIDVCNVRMVEPSKQLPP